jgi:hypothetical protein
MIWVKYKSSRLPVGCRRHACMSIESLNGDEVLYHANKDSSFRKELLDYLGTMMAWRQEGHEQQKLREFNQQVRLTTVRWHLIRTSLSVRSSAKCTAMISSKLSKSGRPRPSSRSSSLTMSGHKRIKCWSSLRCLLDLHCYVHKMSRRKYPYISSAVT